MTRQIIEDLEAMRATVAAGVPVVQVEFTAEEWATAKGALVEVHHGDLSCDGVDQCVFLCRGPYGCGRWCCACFGGDGDEHEQVICSTCWCKYQELKNGGAS